ncbi:9711_t:CDS:2, partial [Entrophospora sp. SA101]
KAGLQVPGEIVYSRSSSLQKNEQENDYSVWTNLGQKACKAGLQVPGEIVYSRSSSLQKNEQEVN